MTRRKTELGRVVCERWSSKASDRGLGKVSDDQVSCQRGSSLSLGICEWSVARFVPWSYLGLKRDRYGVSTVESPADGPGTRRALAVQGWVEPFGDASGTEEARWHGRGSSKVMKSGPDESLLALSMRGTVPPPVGKAPLTCACPANSSPASFPLKDFHIRLRLA